MRRFILAGLALALAVLAGCGSTTVTRTATTPSAARGCIHYHYVVGPDGRRHRVPCNVPPAPSPNPVPSPHPAPNPAPPPPAPVGSGPQVSTCDWQTGNGCSPVPAANSCHYQGTGGGVLPDPSCTPGALYGPSQSSPSTTVCVGGFTATIRPPVSYTGPLKLKIMAAYGVGAQPPASYELDHLVALEDGGAPADPANLWPQPYSPTPGAHQKDDEENFLKHEECSGAITVAQAGLSLALNWFGSYTRDNPPHESFGAEMHRPAVE